MSKIKRNFHTEVRVVYRAYRKLFGIEKTQDECLKLFKIIFPEQYKAKNSGSPTRLIPVERMEQIKRLFRSWKPEGRLREMCEYVVGQLAHPMERKKFIEFCDDILPVAMRIRKLTPKECFRLQDVDDADIATIQSCGVSNSAQYKLAGNSITVAPLYFIFKNLFVETEQKPAPGTQLTLF